LVQYIETIAFNPMCFIILKHHKLGFLGEMTFNLSKIVFTSIIFPQLIFLKTYKHHILIFFCFLEIYLISFTLDLRNYVKESNKHWKKWTYEICLWQNDTHHKIWKFIYIYSKTQVVGWTFGWIFLWWIILIYIN